MSISRKCCAAALFIAVALTFSACGSKEYNKKNNGTSSLVAQPPSSPSLPESERAFIRSLYDFKGKIEASDNPARHKEIVRAFCASIQDRNVKDWIAQLVEIRAGSTPGFSEKVGVTMKFGTLTHKTETGGNGKFVVDDYEHDYQPVSVCLGSLSEIFDRKREQIHETWISESHPIFPTLANLNPGDLVRISGTLVSGHPIVTGTQQQIEDYNFCLAINNHPAGRIAGERDFFGGHKKIPHYGIKLKSIEKFSPPSS